MKKMISFFSELKNRPSVRVFLSHLKESEISVHSTSVAFYLLLSIFPIMMTIGNILPFLNLDGENVLQYIQQLMPISIFNTFKGTFQSLLTEKSTSLLSLSILASLWSASVGVNSLQTTVNNAYGISNRQNFILSRLFSLFIFFNLLLIFILGLFLLNFGEDFFAYLNGVFKFSDSITSFLSHKNLLLTLIGLFFLSILLFLLLPNIQSPKIRFVVPGALFTASGTLVLSKFFALYVDFFGRRVSSYQIIGSVILFMLWLMFEARILILSAVLNASYQDYSINKNRL
ncbi:MAG: YihY/virulence factor BrkB family protein [Streptococcaceae bacterium]|nr:YihY/virulence factor BrkB family protein [Streptococcaceae bacterium]